MTETKKMIMAVTAASALSAGGAVWAMDTWLKPEPACSELDTFKPHEQQRKAAQRCLALQTGTINLINLDPERNKEVAELAAQLPQQLLNVTQGVVNVTVKIVPAPHDVRKDYASMPTCEERAQSDPDDLPDGIAEQIARKIDHEGEDNILMVASQKGICSGNEGTARERSRTIDIKALSSSTALHEGLHTTGLAHFGWGRNKTTGRLLIANHASDAVVDIDKTSAQPNAFFEAYAHNINVMGTEVTSPPALNPVQMAQLKTPQVILGQEADSRQAISPVAHIGGSSEKQVATLRLRDPITLDVDHVNPNSAKEQTYDTLNFSTGPVQLNTYLSNGERNILHVGSRSIQPNQRFTFTTGTQAVRAAVQNDGSINFTAACVS